MTTRRAPEVPAAISTTRSALTLRQVRAIHPPAYNPGAQFRKERKVLDAGARAEVKFDKLLNSRKVGVLSWRLPGVRWKRLSGVVYRPDAAGYVPELQGLVPDQTPQVKGRLPYNVLFEVKGQTTEGSAEKKISTAIVDMAHLCDQTGVVGAILLHTPILTDQQVLAFKAEGRMHSVVVLTAHEVADGQLIPELVRVAKERRRLSLRIGPRGKYTPTKNPTGPERGLAYRVAVRSSVIYTTRKYAGSIF